MESFIWRLKSYHTMPETVIQETLTPEVELLNRELEQTREMLNLNNIERRNLREKQERLQQSVNSAPRNDIERKIIGILSRHFANPVIVLRRTATEVGRRAYELSFNEVENHVVLYAETGMELYRLGLFVESIGTDFIYLTRWK